LPEGFHQVDHLRSFRRRGRHDLFAGDLGLDQLVQLLGVEVVIATGIKVPGGSADQGLGQLQFLRRDLG